MLFIDNLFAVAVIFLNDAALPLNPLTLSNASFLIPYASFIFHIKSGLSALTHVPPIILYVELNSSIKLYVRPAVAFPIGVPLLGCVSFV